MRPSPRLVLFTMLCFAPPLQGQDDSLPTFLRDRGTGLPTSMFGVYIRRNELLVYPFLEYYRDRDYEYKPAELGYGDDHDFRGRYRATEGLLFLGYGLSDRVAIEVEVATIRATLDKSPADTSAMPPRLQEAGLGDVEGQLRMRWSSETQRHPELFSYLEVVTPANRRQRLIGTREWEYKLGSGLVKGTRLGTFTVRAALEYAGEERTIELGEFAAEYLRRLHPRALLYTGVEGTQDEVEWITDLQLRLTRHATLKLNNAIGITSKATDWAPEVGVLLSFPR